MVGWLVASACGSVPLPAHAADGEWVPLGVPMRLRSPLLWDAAERRLLGIGEGSSATADSLRDAWEFREATGWRRIALPRPPAEVDLGFHPLHADPTRRRWLVFPGAGPMHDRLQSWALELSPSPHWRVLDSEPAAPGGSVWLDPRGESAWDLAGHYGTQGHELWTRSLADTGVWRFARAVPNSDHWESWRWVEPLQGRMFVIARDPAAPDTGVVLSLPLAGDEGWAREPGTVPPTLVYGGSAHLVGDADGTRVRCFASGAGVPSESWTYHYRSASPWRYEGALPAELDRRALGDAPDTLWVHGVNGARYQPGAGTLAVPLADPARPALVSAPAWPPFVLPALFFHDRAGGRWLYGALGASHTGATLPADSLWELRLVGADASWRPLRVTAGPPPGGDITRTANDEEGRTLYLLTGSDSSGWPPSPGAELWALRYDGAPRWERIAYRGAPPGLRDASILGFDPVRRELVLSSPGGSGEAVLQALAVDTPDEWRLRAALGSGPTGGDAGTAAYDALRGRLLFRALGPPLVALEYGDPARWLGLDASYCPSFGSNCVPSVSGMRGLFDPVGSRMLLFGGYDSWMMTSYAWLYAIGSGDTLGPVGQLFALGDPGGQQDALAGYDGSRDAIIVLGNVSNFAPSLYEFRFDRGARAVARFAGAAALPDRNALRWSAAPGTRFTLWRAGPSAGWAPLAELEAATDGALAYADRGIEAGTRYGYRLTAPGDAVAPAAEDVWLVASNASTVALAAPWPNPARGALNVSFMTIAAQPAELEVFDVAGRRAWARRWEAPAAGPHHVALAASDLPRAGLYFLRLRQAGVTATRRVVLTP